MICLIYGENKIISELIEKQFKCESLAKAYIYIDEYNNKFYCKSCFSMLIAERFCKEIKLQLETIRRLF